MSRIVFAISLPPELAERLERGRKKRRCKRSAFVRDALRYYLDAGDPEVRYARAKLVKKVGEH